MNAMALVRRMRGVARLVMVSLLLGWTWFGLLPRIAQWPAVEARWRFLESRGIDPSAMYYTELDAMEAILDRLEGRRASDPIRR